MATRYAELLKKQSNLLDDISSSLMNEALAATFTAELEEVEKELYFLDMALAHAFQYDDLEPSFR